jgi:NAD(P)-dependent dehydrogenase (short-subunit alcohol dehydrogenase family)
MKVSKFLNRNLYSKLSQKFFSSRFQDKVVIVTGGGSGIGRATCLKFAKEGAKVVVSDINEKGGKSVLQEMNAKYLTQSLFIKSDISKVQDAEKITQETLQKFGRVDVLVNNAAIFSLTNGINSPEEEWSRSFAVNVTGYAMVSKFAVESMKKTGGGAIINISSIAAWIAIEQMAVYSATKAADLQLSRNMALDLGQYNIRVNAICPGYILTPAVTNYGESIGLTKEEIVKQCADLTILKRIGQPEEIANAIAFLASNEASYITGTHLTVDGGYTTV